MKCEIEGVRRQERGVRTKPPERRGEMYTKNKAVSNRQETCFY